MLRRDLGAKLALFRSLLCGLIAVTGDQVSHHRQNVDVRHEDLALRIKPAAAPIHAAEIARKRDRALNARRREYPFGSQLLHVGPAGVAISRGRSPGILCR